MKTNLDEYKETMHDVRRALGSEKERLTERIEQLDGMYTGRFCVHLGVRRSETSNIKKGV